MSKNRWENRIDIRDTISAVASTTIIDSACSSTPHYIINACYLPGCPWWWVVKKWLDPRRDVLQLLQPQQRASDRRNPLFCSLLLLALAPLESVAARVQTSPIITLSLSAMIPMVSIIIHGYPSIPPRAAIIPISRRNYPRYYVLPTFLRNVSSRATSFHLFFFFLSFLLLLLLLRRFARCFFFSKRGWHASWKCSRGVIVAGFLFQKMGNYGDCITRWWIARWLNKA